MIVFDTEDNSAELLAAGKSGFDKSLLQIAAICDNGKSFHAKNDVKGFLKFCHEQADNDVWAFNTQYDIGNLCHEGIIKLDDFDMTLVKGRFIKAKIEGLNFYDCHNLCGAGSLAALGKAVGLEKLDGKASGYADKNYVLRDCQIPMKWLKFVADQCENLCVGNIPATLGSLCVKAYQASGGENWFEASETSASALIGARVELFSGGGKGRICYADVNSLYPWCMTQLFPTCLEDLDGSLDGYGIADIDIEVPECFVAPLPCKDDEGRLIFPTGKFSGVWTLCEIRNAVKNAGAKVLKIRWSYGSKGAKPYYREYITSMYQNRLAAKNSTESLFWKLLMNNLYGRLAISGEVSRSLLLSDDNKDKGLAYGRKILVDHKMPLPEFSNYLHAAHVLSYARIKLFSFLKMINPQDLIYCDTDSVIFFCKGEPPFPASKNLGEMKIEAWGKYCKPFLPKTYIFDDTYKAKGVPKKRAKDFIETGKAEYDLPFKLREAIHFYDEDNSRKLSVWRKVEKIRAMTYDRKKIKGKHFLPIRLNNLKNNSRLKKDL